MMIVIWSCLRIVRGSGGATAKRLIDAGLAAPGSGAVASVARNREPPLPRMTAPTVAGSLRWAGGGATGPCPRVAGCVCATATDVHPSTTNVAHLFMRVSLVHGRRAHANCVYLRASAV